MNLRAGSMGAFEPTSSTTAVLDVLIVYEDSDTGLRAKHSLDSLPGNFRVEADVTTRLYRIDLLRAVFLREQAAMEAAAADVVVLSLHGGRTVPPDVAKWLARWLDLKEDRAYALGLLLDPKPASEVDTDPLISYVRDLVQGEGVDILYGFCAETTSSRAFITRGAPPVFENLSTIRKEERRDMGSYLHWGINE